jgi:hypothetical protein
VTVPAEGIGVITPKILDQVEHVGAELGKFGQGFAKTVEILGFWTHRGNSSSAHGKFMVKKIGLA